MQLVVSCIAATISPNISCSTTSLCMVACCVICSVLASKVLHQWVLVWFLFVSPMGIHRMAVSVMAFLKHVNSPFTLPLCYYYCECHLPYSGWASLCDARSMTRKYSSWGRLNIKQTIWSFPFQFFSSTQLKVEQYMVLVGLRLAYVLLYYGMSLVSEIRSFAHSLLWSVFGI